jgi:hypothetical protein
MSQADDRQSKTNISMRIERTYAHSSDELKRRLEQLTDGFSAIKLPAGVAVSNISKSWQGDTLKFSFTAGMGFFSATIGGQAMVSGSSVILEVTLPGMMSAMIDERDVEGRIAAQLDAVMA